MFVPLNNATRCDLFASDHLGGRGGRRLCVPDRVCSGVGWVWSRQSFWLLLVLGCYSLFIGCWLIGLVEEGRLGKVSC